jgi:hypothetical protein
LHAYAGPRPRRVGPRSLPRRPLRRGPARDPGADPAHHRFRAVVTGNPHPVTVHAERPVEALELTREEFARIREGDLELRATVLEILMHEIHDDVNRALRSLANGRGTPLTAS